MARTDEALSPAPAVALQRSSLTLTTTAGESRLQLDKIIQANNQQMSRLNTFAAQTRAETRRRRQRRLISFINSSR